LLDMPTIATECGRISRPTAAAPLALVCISNYPDLL
jgi:hypothetical protein